MKRLLPLFILLTMIVPICGCADHSENATHTAIEQPYTPYQHITQIDHCVVEPDDELHMTQQDKIYYRNLMDAVLSRKDSVTLSNSKENNEYYIDLLRQSPYYFFLSDCVLSDDTALLTYAYSTKKQEEMLRFIDDTFLDIVNTHADEEDNTLDKLLNVYGAVARLMTYDHERTDNKQLGSPMFNYPADEIYKAFRTGESLCYGFAYTLRFALLQLDIDCFCVYGPCSQRNEAHMWNIFKYNGKFYTCDSAWDRSDDGYPQLYHFGKTDKERELDSLTRTGFSSEFFAEYGEISCTDETFSIFRSIDRYSWVRTHQYYVEDFDSNEYTFDTTTMKKK